MFDKKYKEVAKGYLHCLKNYIYIRIPMPMAMPMTMPTFQNDRNKVNQKKVIKTIRHVNAPITLTNEKNSPKTSFFTNLLRIIFAEDFSQRNSK